MDLQAQLKAVVSLGPLGDFDIIALLGLDASIAFNLNDLLGVPDFKVFGGKVVAAAAEEKPTITLGQVSKDKEQPIITSAGLVGQAEKGVAAAFAATATDNCASGADLHFKWLFDDGGVGFGPNVTHAFKTAGFHTGTVSVTDIAGLVDERDFFFVIGANGNTNIKYSGPVGLSANDPGPIELGGTLLDWQGRGIKGKQLQFSIRTKGGDIVIGPLGEHDGRQRQGSREHPAARPG